MNRTLFIIALQLAVFWPVCSWYVVRVTDSTDETWGILALLTLLFFIFRKRSCAPEPHRNALLLPALFVLLYAVTYHFLPPLARAVIAATALGLSISSLRFGRRLHTGVLGLVYLSLPLIPSLQFYGGYPLRVMVASMTAPVLRLGGFAVIQEGTCLNWAGQLIWIDAPCSGIRMLWVGLYLAFTLICLHELRFLKALAVIGAALFVIILGNVFRAVALFYIEAKVFSLPGWGHEYAGIVTFVLVAIGIVCATHLIRRGRVCLEQFST